MRRLYRNVPPLSGRQTGSLPDRFTIPVGHFSFREKIPWGNFAVNVIGSFVIGIFFGLAEKAHLISANMNVFLITGFCGGFTTFSSFADDMFLLMQNKHWGYLSTYLILSIVLGIALVWLGRSLVKPA